MAGVVIALGCTGSLHAAIASQTFYLNQSNKLADGISNYGIVQVTADQSARTVQFDIQAPYLYSGSQPVANYGFSQFYFNTKNLGLSSGFSVLSSPANWELDDKGYQVSEFGWYDLEFSAKAGRGTGGLPVQPSLSFTLKLNNSANATIENFANLDGVSSTKTPDAFFAAHIQGFNLTGGETSHFVASSVPEPSTILLWSAAGVCALGVARRFRKR